MQFQKEKGIYVYFLATSYENESASRIIRWIRYESLEQFFWFNTEYEIQHNYGHNIYDRRCNQVTNYNYGRGYCKRRFIRREIICNIINCYEHDSSGTNLLVAFDESGKQYLPDVLVGARRAWLDSKAGKKYKNRYCRNLNGRHKKAYGKFRNMRTLQERKWAEAWDDVEFAPKTRRARVNRNLPDAWDDWHVHNDKSWKTQSKRKHQWKIK